MKDYVRDLYKKISENIGETPELFHYDYFKLENGELYYRGNRKPLSTEGKLKSIGMLADILGKNRPSGKDLYKQTIVVSAVTHDTSLVRYSKYFC